MYYKLHSNYARNLFLSKNEARIEKSNNHCTYKGSKFGKQSTLLIGFKTSFYHTVVVIRI